jgi:hypothetical protein
MNVISNATLRHLIEQPAGAYVSAYLPLEHGAVGTLRNQVALKNLLKQAEARLIALGARETEAAAFLAHSRADLRDNGFWNRAGKGMALFIGAGAPMNIDLPFAPAERVFTGARFMIRPLLPALGNDPRGNLLALSQHNVRLFKLSRERIDEVALKGLPHSVAEAGSADPPRHERGARAVPSAGGQGGATAISYGTVADEKEQIRRFLEQVDDGVVGLLRDDKAPLLLMGVAPLLAIYREITSHPHVMTESILGSPDRMSAAEAHAEAMPVFEAQSGQGAQDAIHQFQNAVQTPRASAHLDDILRAAAQGRVDALMLDESRFAWGQYDPITGDVVARMGYAAHPEHDDEDELMDLAASQTLLHRGTAFALPAKQMPFGLAIAAVYRY